jgi:hypothetical protein
MAEQEANVAPSEFGGKADQSPDDTAGFDPAALESKMQGELDKAFGNDNFDDEVVDDDPEVTDEDVDTDGEDDSPADQDEESEDTDVEDVDDESGDEEIESEAAAKPVVKTGKTSTLPEAYIRSLKANEWTDEEIASNHEALGAKFVEMAANIHAKRKAEVAIWAARGRKAQEEGQNQQPGPVAESVPQQLQPVDLSKIKEKYGDDELFDQIVNPLNSTIAALNSVLPQLQQGVETIQQTHRDAAANEVHKFFDDKSMDAYRKVYGGADKARTADQMDKRREVLELASQLMAGAGASHQDMTLNEALVIAHDHAAADFKEQNVRRSIKKEVKKRNRGISLKPSQRGGQPRPSSESNNGEPLTQEQLERKIAGKMRNLFK